MDQVSQKIELLAPGGDVDSIKAAILAGADAVYCGLDRFNARNRATNISFDNLQGILSLAHKNSCQVFLTLNIIVVENEIPALLGLLNKLVNTSIDGIIVQDLGLLYLVSRYFKSLKIHASTQLTTHNEGQIKFLSKLGVSRLNLSRELNIDEIKALTTVAAEYNISTEVFVHGSYCISFSGICYMSSVQSGNSGNRGRCSQPCRDQYKTTAAGRDYPLNLKDNSAFFDLKELADAGVSSLKIEGRIKKYDYVFTVVESYKKQLQNLYNLDKSTLDNSNLYKVFNRDFSNSFLKGDINKDMFIDDPRDHSIKHLSEINSYANTKDLENDQIELYEAKEENKATIENKIKQLSTSKDPLTIRISGKCDTPLKVSIHKPDDSFEVLSEINLSDKGTQALNEEVILKRLKAINETEYFIQYLDLENLQRDVYIPFKELTSIKKRVLFILNGSKEHIDPIDAPILKKLNIEKIKPTLAVLISSENDLHLVDKTRANIHFQLPESFKNSVDEFVKLFNSNSRLIPWFPSVLIDENYAAAVELLLKLMPKRIVTDNTGIAYEAFDNGIEWIAGPYLNIVNSFSLLNLKENFNCSGAFISNEISKNQIQQIRKPEDFKLYYSIYHPIELMTSRQCLFHQVSACEKHKIGDTCISDCEKSSTITNLKEDSFFINKSKGNYHKIHHSINFLNADIVKGLPGLFSGFLIDLRDIKTKTSLGIDKPGIIGLFDVFLNKNYDPEVEIDRHIHPTSNAQYVRGI